MVTLNITYEERFDKMKVLFGNIFYDLSCLLARHVPSIQELKLYLSRCFPELKPQLDKAETTDNVVDIVQEKCTIVNLVCLEAIADKFNLHEVIVHITDFKKAVDDFCNKVRVSVCNDDNFLANTSCILKCDTVVFIIDWEANDYSLELIKGLLSKAFEDVVKKLLVTDRITYENKGYIC